MNTDELLAAILAELRKQVQRGVVLAFVLNVNSNVPQDQRFWPPLFTLAITNDGPANIEFKTPYGGPSSWTLLRPTEQFILNFQNGVIEDVAVRLQLVGGAATAVRLVGVY